MKFSHHAESIVQTMKAEKPWIEETWAECGLNVNDVWRLEFSVNQFTKQIYCNETGLRIDNSTDILNPEFFTSVFNQLCKDYFLFGTNNGGTRRNKIKILNLIDYNENRFCKLNFSESKESNRSDKIYIKKMYTINSEARGDDFNNSIHRDKILQDFIITRSLVDWADKKGYYPKTGTNN